jgi:hypothetical protein
MLSTREILDFEHSMRKDFNSSINSSIFSLPDSCSIDTSLFTGSNDDLLEKLQSKILYAKLTANVGERRVSMMFQLSHIFRYIEWMQMFALKVENI